MVSRERQRKRTADDNRLSEQDAKCDSREILLAELNLKRRRQKKTVVFMFAYCLMKQKKKDQELKK